jgi:hypothetical protein
MLKVLSEKVAHCHRQAREAREKAERATDFAAKRDYLNLERRWLLLAQSYEWTERVALFNAEMKNRIAAFGLSRPAAIPRVMCPECGRRMRPSPADLQSDLVALECKCGHTLSLVRQRL